MEKKTDALEDLFEDLQGKTKEFLQPNPAARAKMAALKMSSSQAKSQYPQTEGILGSAMVQHGKKLGEDSCLGQALMETGEYIWDTFNISIKSIFYRRCVETSS